MHTVLQKIQSAVRSSKFFTVILALFIVQGVLFAVIVDPSDIERQPDGAVARGGGVVPDGNRHIGAIYYYAQQPLTAGPIINDMDGRDLWMGDLERFPSYLYYYLLSIPTRAALAVGAPDAAIVMLIRLVGLGFGVIALWTLRRLALELKSGVVAANLATLAMAVTGAFVWLAPAENYDVLGLTLWLLFLLASVRLFLRKDARYIYWMVLWFCLVGIAKYTYIPFAAVAGVAAYWLYLRETGYKNAWRTIKQQWRNWRKELTKYQVAGLAVIMVVAGMMFVERIGGNLLFYRSFNPSCTQIHTFDACMKFGVFERNYTRANVYDRQLESGEVEPITYNPVSYTGFWLNRYYSSMYGYVGHIWIYEFWSLMYAGMALALAAIVTLVIYLKKRRILLLQTLAEKYIFAVIMLLVVLQYVFNLRTFINFGGELYAYAHQGRYLLSAIGLIYILLAMVAVRAVRAMSHRTQQWVILVLLIIGCIMLLTNSALVSFFVHATSLEWYNPAVHIYVPDWLLSLR